MYLQVRAPNVGTFFLCGSISVGTFTFPVSLVTVASRDLDEVKTEYCGRIFSGYILLWSCCLLIDVN